MSSADDITLDFQSINFESDRAIVDSLFLEYQKKCKSAADNNQVKPEAKKDGITENPLPLFDVTPSRYVGGWYFSKLHIAGQLAVTMYPLHLEEIGSIDIKKESKVLGKHYHGEESVAKFAIWLNKRLNGMGCKAQLKIGEEVANFGYGLAQSVSGLWLGKYINKKYG